MIEPTVRAAVAADVDALGLLECDARAALKDARGGARWLDEHPPVEDWRSAIDARIVLVGVLDADDIGAVPVGYLVADMDGEDSIIVIDQVYVESAARELGYGDALVAGAIAEGRRRGAELIEAQTLPGDREIKNLYERAGVTARLITVSKRLDEL